MEKNELKNKLNRLVQNDLRLTLDILSDFCDKQNIESDFKQSVIMQSGNYNDYLDVLNAGTELTRDLEPRKNKVRLAVIDLISEIPDFDDYEIPEIIKKEIQKSDIDLEKVAKKLGKTLFDNLKPTERELVKKHFYLRLNRENQERTFERYIKSTKLFKKPIIFFVHGFLEDEPSDLVSRLLHIAEQYYETNVVHLKPENIGSGNIDDIKYDLINNTEEAVNQELGKTMQKLSRKTDTEIGEYILKQDFAQKAIIMVEQPINSSVWDKTLADALQKWYIPQYWNFDLPDTEQPFFVFININYTQQKKSFFKSIFGKTDKSIEKEIENIHHQYKDTTVFIPRLTEIEQHHVKSFLNEYDLEDTDFIQPGEKLSYQEFFNKCKDHIAYWLKQQDNVI